MKKQHSSLTRQPFISVIMPVYNAENFIVEAINSILNQTYRNFELIIVDDASTDTSWEIIKQYAKLYPKYVKAIRLKKNRNCGGDACANEGLRIAKGKYIARMDADDISYPKRLAIQVAYLEKHPKIFLVGTHADVVDTDGKLIGEKKEPTNQKAIYNAYFSFNPLTHPSCMFRRITKKKRFTYSIGYSANNDYYTFFMALCKRKQFVNLSEKLIAHRIHNHSSTFTNIKGKFFNVLKIRFMMVRKYGYVPQPKDVLICLLQTIIIFSLPESLLLYLYLFAKGIIRIKIPFMYVIARSPKVTEAISLSQIRLPRPRLDESSQ